MEPQPTVLIVDDEPIIRLTLESLLASIDVRLIFAEDGEKGLELAEANRPDLVLLDLMMPGMDGYEVCRRIRENPGLTEIPVIMITALDDRDSCLKGLLEGADDFLTKSFDGLALIARVQTIIRLNRYRHLVEQRKTLERLHKELLISYHDTLEGWADALDLRDKETEGHMRRVMEKSIAFAKAAGVTGEKELEDLRMGALLYDVGKLGVPDAILLKPGKLTDEEWVIMRRHPEYAYKWLSHIAFLNEALKVPYCHHEKWDGTGYPRGLKGLEIPLYARLFIIVDVWNALRSDRPYRKALPEEDGLAYIQGESGRYFDPELVQVFLEMYKGA
ncbi:MAG: response regulator [Spirochaetes bacterium]|nr:response regulator [Spirochaetota bacterium]